MSEPLTEIEAARRVVQLARGLAVALATYDAVVMRDAPRSHDRGGGRDENNEGDRLDDSGMPSDASPVAAAR